MADGSKRRGWRTLLPFRRSKRRKLEIPVEHVGLVSYLTYGWLDGFMWRAFRTGLTANTIWKCPHVDGAEHNARRLEEMWQAELQLKGREGASLSRVFMRFIRKRLLLSMAVLVLAMALLLLTVAYILLEVLEYSYARKGQLWHGLILVAAFLVADILQNILFICVFSISHIAGARLRSGALLMLYRKLLRVPYLKDKTTGYIVNLFANDSQRIFDGVSYASMLLVAPLLGIATTAYAIYLIGLWSLVGFAVLLLLFPIQMCIGKLIMTWRARVMAITDRRVCLMGEMLANVKFIKMYSWEKPLARDIIEIRDGEKSVLWKVNMATSMMFSISAIVVAIATISTIMAHTLTGHDLTAVKAFTYLAVFSSIQGKLMLSTMGVKHFSELKVTANRFQEVLMLEDRPLIPSITESSPLGGSDYVIELDSASLAWSGPGHVGGPEEGFQNGPTSNGHVKKVPTSVDQSTELHLLNTTTREGEEPVDNVLTSITFKIHRGDVAAVTGPIGSGKSALLTGLLGQMRVSQGEVCVYGKVAYVPQQAWLFNASLRENILFGNQLDERRYSAVIEACCLKMDIDILPAGDATEVGERGVTLSGGQKQRISLARALYSDRDIYLLDDPFSAVDPDIADRLYQQVVQNELVGKTVMLVTNTAKYLPSCDHILYLRGGTIVQQGTHDDLREAGGEYSDFYLNAKEHDGESRDPMTEVTQNRTTQHDRRSVIRRTSTRKKREEITEEAKKLIEKEEQEVGAVGWRTYRNYMTAAGGVIAVILVLVLFVLAEGSRAFSYWWLAHWLSMGSANTTVKDGNMTVISKSITDNPNLGFYNLVYGLTTIGTLVLFLIKAAVFTKFSIRASNKLHLWLLRAVLRCPMAFFDTTPLGRIINRFSKDMDELDSQLPTMVEQTIQSIVSIIMYIVMIGVIIQWFLVAIPPLAFIFFFVYAIFRVGLRDIKRLQNISVSPLLSHISATMQGLHSLHAYNKVQDFTNRFVDMLDHNTVTLILFNCGMRWINLRLSFITSIIVCVTALLVVLLQDVVKPAYAGLAIVYSAQLAGLFQFLVRSAVESEARFTSAERVDSYAEDLEREGPLVVDSYRPPGTWPSDGHIRFTDYRMRYREGLPLVLKGVTCAFNPGERVGIVGRTGSGKSSLASALFRLVEPSSGYVEIDGMDITRMGFEDLRTKLSAIPQDPVLFSGTVRSNLDPFHHHIDLELWRALEKCHIKDTILTLDQQLDAAVTEGGENFSAGERQLLCIARVFLRHSKILVLDEATAAMDSETDALIQTALKEVFEGCTLLIIAHRLNTVLQVDRVLVMEKGEVVEFDTPEALMANENSRFNQLMSLTNDGSAKQTESMDMLASDAWV